MLARSHSADECFHRMAPIRHAKSVRRPPHLSNAIAQFCGTADGIRCCVSRRAPLASEPRLQLGWLVLHRKLEYRRFLSPKQMREKDNLPVWELQSIMMGTLAWKLPVESLIQPTTKGPT